MSLKNQRNLGYGLVGFGLSLITGFSLTGYGYGLLFLAVVVPTGLTLSFLTLKEAVSLKSSNPQITYRDCIKIAGGFYFLIFLGFLVVVLVGMLKGF